MSTTPAKRRRTVLTVATLACGYWLLPVIAGATSCRETIVTLARARGRVRYVAGAGDLGRVAPGVRVELTTIVAREPRVVATVESDGEGHFAFETPKAGRLYGLAFKAPGAHGFVGLRLDASSPHTWLTMELDDHPTGDCPANRATVGQPD